MSILPGNAGSLVPFVIFFALAHLFKAARFYLVLLEQDIPLKSYLFLYARTTLVNLVVPFKLGELYRVAAVYNVTGKGDRTPHGAMSVLSVCVDRFFDTAALLSIILPFGLIYGGSIEFAPLMLFLALFIFALVYLSVPKSYLYLNEYIIMYRQTRRSVSILKWLEVIKEWYEFTHGLIKGRAPMIIIASFLGWGAEFMALRSFFSMLGKSFAIEDFSRYINSLLSSVPYSMARAYNSLGTAIIAMMTLVLFIMWMAEKPGEKGRKNAADPDRI